jgi:hypothetical protein
MQASALAYALAKLYRRDGVRTVIGGPHARAFPTIRERMPEIRRASFVRGRPGLASIAPMLSSLGCPCRCDFCVDWNTDYVALPGDQLESDLRYVSERCSSRRPGCRSSKRANA